MIGSRRGDIVDARVMVSRCREEVGVTVEELRDLLSALPCEMLVLVNGYESGFSDVAAGTIDVQELARGEDFVYLGRYVTPEQAVAEVGGRNAEWRMVVGGKPPRPVGEPITAVVITRAER